MASDWPNGPDKLEKLFHWPDYNADYLLRHHERKDSFRKNFSKLSERNIYVTESYAGMGTGSYTLHWQHNAFKRFLVAFRLSDQYQILSDQLPGFVHAYIFNTYTYIF